MGLVIFRCSALGARSMTLRTTVVAALVLLASFSGQAFAQAPDPSTLHDALHLTPVQEAAWRRYQLAIAPDPTAAARRKAAQAMIANLATPRRIDLIDAEMDADVAAMHQQGEAVKAFYATLTPTQQRVFDTQTSPRPGAMGGN